MSKNLLNKTTIGKTNTQKISKNGQTRGHNNNHQRQSFFLDLGIESIKSWQREQYLFLSVKIGPLIVIWTTPPSVVWMNGQFDPSRLFTTLSFPNA